MTLIGAAKEHGIEFIYAISPGLDITFSNQKEVSTLKRKLDQVWQHSVLHSYKHCLCTLDTYLHELIYLTVNHFIGFHFQPLSLTLRLLTLAASLLPYFSMILTTTCALLTKKCSAHLHTLRFPLPMKSISTWESLKPSCFVPQVPLFFIWIFCVFFRIVSSSLIIICLFSLLWYTEYCGTFCYPNVPQSPYLHTVGEKLLPGIDVLWTGESCTVFCKQSKNYYY